MTKMLTPSQVNNLKATLVSGDHMFVRIFDALSDTTRCRIFQLLMEHHDICVTDIAAIFDITVPAASHQLKILEIAGLVRRERMGQMICYVTKEDDPGVRSIIRLLRPELRAERKSLLSRLGIK